MISGMEHDSRFEFFGKQEPREHHLCPHCGESGSRVDDMEWFWGGVRAEDVGYLCSMCTREWTIRRYIYSGFEKYRGPAYALIYIPVATAQQKP